MANRIIRRLASLLDVDLTGIADGDALTYRSSDGKIIPGTGGGGSSTLAGLSDVTGTAGTGKAPVSNGAGSFPLTDIATQAELAAEASARDAAIAAAIAALVNSAPGVLDTLEEIADALGDDPNFATTMTTALAAKQPLDSDLTAIAALSTTSYGRALLALADAAALRTAAGLGTAATAATGDFDAAGAAAAAQAASQPLDSDLTALAGLAIAADKLPYGNGSHTMALADFTAAARSLLDDADASAMLTTLGLSAFAKTLMDDADASTFLSTLGVSTFIKTLLDDADAATARATLGVSVSTDGWTDDSANTWTYASATTFTVSGDRTAVFAVGTKLGLTQTTAKYFVVTGSSFSSGTTTVTVTAGSDYSLANAAITAQKYSYAAGPQGYPAFFNYTPTVTGMSGAATISQAQFSVQGRTVTVWYDVSGTSNATTFTITSPIAANASVTFALATCIVVDNSATQTSPGRVQINSGSSSIQFGKNQTSTGGFTASGTKDCIGTLVYAI